MMSLSEKLRLQKAKLNHTETIVKTVSGEVMREKCADGVFRAEKLAGKFAGFVVDTKPDLRMNRIVDRVYMSSQDPVSDVTLLNQYQIKHILSVGVQIPVLNDAIRYSYIEALDLPEFDMMSSFQMSYDVINEAVRKGDNILVHCNAGISRSATVVIAYLMKANRLSYEQARHLVSKMRTNIRPNEGFVRQLRLYEKQLLGDTE